MLALGTLISVILKKIKIIFIHNYLRWWEIPKGYSSKGSNISDYVNIIVSALYQISLNKVSRAENDRMETASSAVTSIRRRNNKEKSTWRTHRYFVAFESRIHVEIFMSNRWHNFHIDSPFKVNEISTNNLRRISTSNR